MRSEIKLFEDQYRFFKNMASKRLLIAFVEFMFEDIEPTNLKGLEKTVFESMRKRMENSKKIHDGNSKGGRSSRGGGRPPKDSWELEGENKSKTSQKTSQKQLKNNEEGSMKIEEKENIKRKFLEYVYLTDKEYDKLIDTYGEKVIKNYIEKLNNRIGENPNEKKRKKKSHYHTLCKRINDAGIPKIPPKPPENETGVYDLPF